MIRLNRLPRKSISSVSLEEHTFAVCRFILLSGDVHIHVCVCAWVCVCIYWIDLFCFRSATRSYKFNHTEFNEISTEIAQESSGPIVSRTFIARFKSALTTSHKRVSLNKTAVRSCSVMHDCSMNSPCLLRLEWSTFRADYSLLIFR